MKTLTVRQAISQGRFADQLFAHEVTGDLFLFAMAFHRVLITTGHRETSFAEARDFLGWPSGKIRTLIFSDAPKWVPTEPRTYGCQAPMIRRDGVCGNTTRSTSVTLRDPDTGEWTWAHACRRHRDELENRAEAQRQAWIANGKPAPHPNTGGVLPRVFGGDWTATYTSVGAVFTGELPYPKLKPLPSTGEIEPTAPVRPTLTVVPTRPK